jgi:hypothetical protein
MAGRQRRHRQAVFTCYDSHAVASIEESEARGEIRFTATVSVIAPASSATIRLNCKDDAVTDLNGLSTRRSLRGSWAVSAGQFSTFAAAPGLSLGAFALLSQELSLRAAGGQDGLAGGRVRYGVD